MDVTPMYLYIEMELCQSDLRQWMDCNPARETHVVQSFLLQILEGVRYLHDDKAIIHRDLKPSNILFSQNQRVLKIADFGLATVDLIKAFPVECEIAGDVLSQVHGTILYRSPEQARGDGYDYKVDIFALGLIYFEMHRPMQTDQERAKEFSIAREGKITGYCTDVNLILEMLKNNPIDRPNAKDVLEKLKSHLL